MQTQKPSTKDIEKAEDWTYMAQGGLHLAFAGQGKCDGLVLKVEKQQGKPAHKEKEDPVACKFTEAFLAAFTSDPVFSQYVPHSFVPVLPHDAKATDAIFAYLTDIARKGTPATSKYDVSNLSINRVESPTLEENLMGPTFPHVDIRPDDLLLHFEIKVKSSLDVMPMVHKKEFSEMIFPGKPESDRTEFLDSLEKFSGKRLGSEKSQTFLRDVQFIANPSSPQPKLAPSPFDGPGFFADDVEQNMQAIRLIAEKETNYLRVFNPSGKRLSMVEYEPILSSWFDNWRDALPQILSKAINRRVVKILEYLQRFLGESIGDTIVQLHRLGYEKVKSTKGLQYLVSLAEPILKAILHEFDKFDFVETAQPIPDIFSKIRTSVLSALDHKQDQAAPEDIDLMICYVSLIVMMTFSDSSIVLKLVVSRHHLQVHPSAANEQVDPRVSFGTVTVDGIQYHLASRCTIIDFGPKKDSNVANLLQTFQKFPVYSTYLAGKYLTQKITEESPGDEVTTN